MLSALIFRVVAKCRYPVRYPAERTDVFGFRRTVGSTRHSHPTAPGFSTDRRACGRGKELEAWSHRLDAAYCSGAAPDVETVSRLLAERRMNWFEDGVVPILAASVHSEPRTMPLNLPAAGAVNGLPHGAIVEIDCEISALGIRALPAPPLPTGPWEMTLQLLDFERAVLSLPDVPSKRALSEALELHPLTQGHDVLQTACELATVMSKTAHCGRR